MSETEIKSSKTWYEIHATCDLRLGGNTTVYSGFERGMTDNGWACWSRYGATRFASAHDAWESTKHLPGHWDFMKIRDLKCHQITEDIIRTRIVMTEDGEIV